jgi:hypothetical protein
MPRSGRIGSLGIPSVHGKIGISTSNHEQVNGIAGHDSTNLTSEFLQRCHGIFPNVVATGRYLAADARPEFGVSTVKSPTCSRFTVSRR